MNRIEEVEEKASRRSDKEEEEEEEEEGWEPLSSGNILIMLIKCEM
jgi:hypothetical protein